MSDVYEHESIYVPPEDLWKELIPVNAMGEQGWIFCGVTETASQGKVFYFRRLKARLDPKGDPA